MPQVDVRVFVALGLVERQGCWLVTRRSAGRVFAGLWEFPGGKVEPGESAVAAVVREVSEETGLAVEAVDDLGVVDTLHGGEVVALRLIVCRAGEGEPAARDLAVDAVQWVRTEELAGLPMPPANREVIRRLVEFVSQGK